MNDLWRLFFFPLGDLYKKINTQRGILFPEEQVSCRVAVVPPVSPCSVKGCSSGSKSCLTSLQAVILILILIQVMNWFVQICLAMKHVHDRKILHRDLKSQVSLGYMFIHENSLLIWVSTRMAIMYIIINCPVLFIWRTCHVDSSCQGCQ